MPFDYVEAAKKILNDLPIFMSNNTFRIISGLFYDRSILIKTRDKQIEEIKLLKDKLKIIEQVLSMSSVQINLLSNTLKKS